MAVPGRSFGFGSARLVLTDGDKFHFRCDDAFSRIVQLGHVSARFRPQWFTDVLKTKLSQLQIDRTDAAVGRAYLWKLFNILPAEYPGASQWRESLTDV